MSKPLTEDHLDLKDTAVAFLINALATVRDRNKENNMLIDEAIQKVLERNKSWINPIDQTMKSYY